MTRSIPRNRDEPTTATVAECASGASFDSICHFSSPVLLHSDQRVSAGKDHDPWPSNGPGGEELSAVDLRHSSVPSAASKAIVRGLLPGSTLLDEHDVIARADYPPIRLVRGAGHPLNGAVGDVQRP